MEKLNKTNLSETEIRDLLDDSNVTSDKKDIDKSIELACVNLGTSACMEACKDGCKTSSKTGDTCKDGCKPSCLSGCKGSGK